jgi:hypothetical protein
MTDRVEALRQAAQARHSATLRRAKEALPALVASGAPVTFARLPMVAKVSTVLALLPSRTARRGATPPRAEPRQAPAATTRRVSYRRLPSPTAPRLPR